MDEYYVLMRTNRTCTCRIDDVFGDVNNAMFNDEILPYSFDHGKPCQVFQLHPFLLTSSARADSTDSTLRPPSLPDLRRGAGIVPSVIQQRLQLPIVYLLFLPLPDRIPPEIVDLILGFARFHPALPPCSVAYEIDAHNDFDYNEAAMRRVSCELTSEKGVDLP